MTFTSETLTYREGTYAAKDDPLKFTKETIKLEKQPDGTYGVGPSKILVKIHSMALNPVDTMAQSALKFPITLLVSKGTVGFDYSGTIASIGSQAATKTKFKTGDKVCGLIVHPFSVGTLAEYIVLDSSNPKDLAITTIPKNQSLNEASSWPVVHATAADMARGLDFNDKKVLVLGAGTAVGRYSVQLARIGKAKEIVATCSPRSNEVITSLGATTIIDYTKHDTVLPPVLKSVESSGKFDYVFDCCGSSDLFPQGKAVLHPKSKYVTAVGHKKLDYAQFSILRNAFPFFKSKLTSIWYHLGLLGYQFEHITYDPVRVYLGDGKKLFESGELVAHLDSVQKFEDMNKAFEIVKSGKAQGKVVIQVEEDS